MTESIGTLLSQSTEAFKAKLPAFLVGAVLFGALNFAAQFHFENKAIDSIESSPFANLERLEELAERAEQGDAEALEELLAEAGMLEDGAMNEAMMEDMAMGMMTGILPAFGLFFVVSLLVSAVAAAYYLILATNKADSAQAAFSMTPKYILPLIGLWVWAFLRSFAWIPFIGFIFALVIGPRLLPAYVIFMNEGKGVIASVSESYARTRGYWGKLFGNMLAAGVCTWLAVVVIGLAVAMVPGEPSFLLIIPIIATSMAMAYMTVFAVKLSETVLKNPLAVQPTQ